MRRHEYSRVRAGHGSASIEPLSNPKTSKGTNMSPMLAKRYENNGQTNSAAIMRDVLIAGAVLILGAVCWPFYSVPTGFRGVVTQFGAIKSTEPEGLAILPPWQKITNFSIRAEEANIDKAEGSTSDTQPVHVSMTVRY